MGQLTDENQDHVKEYLDKTMGPEEGILPIEEQEGVIDLIFRVTDEEGIDGFNGSFNLQDGEELSGNLNVGYNSGGLDVEDENFGAIAMGLPLEVRLDCDASIELGPASLDADGGFRVSVDEAGNVFDVLLKERNYEGSGETTVRTKQGTYTMNVTGNETASSGKAGLGEGTVTINYKGKGGETGTASYKITETKTPEAVKKYDVQLVESNCSGSFGGITCEDLTQAVQNDVAKMNRGDSYLPTANTNEDGTSTHVGVDPETYRSAHEAGRDAGYNQGLTHGAAGGCAAGGVGGLGVGGILGLAVAYVSNRFIKNMRLQNYQRPGPGPTK